MTGFLSFPLALLPVLVFLGILVFMDTFKLMPLRAVLRAIAIGGLAAMASYAVNSWLIHATPMPETVFRRYAAPLIEEILKAAFVVYLIRRSKVGFLVDAAIAGFAVGAGFALVENVNYLVSIEDRNLFLWVVRGFGTAIMHGSTVAIFAIVSKSLVERHGTPRFAYFLPGLALAFGIHSFFNHFLFHPLVFTAIQLTVLPVLVIVVFARSEQATRKWLGVGFDTDVELLDIVNGEEIAESRIGQYLMSLQQHFPGPVVADMLCLLRIHLELSVRGKGILLARAAGLKVPPDELVKANLEELRFLRKSVGPAGQLALAPFLNMTSRELWQLYMLEEESSRPWTLGE